MATMSMAGQLDCALSTSRSWKGEDFTLLPLLLRMTAGRPGRFVELGAYTGIDFSNTLVLERCFGWTGLLIEANSQNFKKLAHSGRSATLRRSAICAGAAWGNHEHHTGWRCSRRPGQRHVRASFVATENGEVTISRKRLSHAKASPA